MDDTNEFDSISSFSEWLEEKGHVTSIEFVEYELSASELWDLHKIWAEETGNQW